MPEQVTSRFAKALENNAIMFFVLAMLNVGLFYFGSNMEDIEHLPFLGWISDPEYRYAVLLISSLTMLIAFRRDIALFARFTNTIKQIIFYTLLGTTLASMTFLIYHYDAEHRLSPTRMDNDSAKSGTIPTKTVDNYETDLQKKNDEIVRLEKQIEENQNIIDSLELKTSLTEAARDSIQKFLQDSIDGLYVLLNNNVRETETLRNNLQVFLMHVRSIHPTIASISNHLSSHANFQQIVVNMSVDDVVNNNFQIGLKVFNTQEVKYLRICPNTFKPYMAIKICGTNTSTFVYELTCDRGQSFGPGTEYRYEFYVHGTNIHTEIWQNGTLLRIEQPS